MGTSWRGHIIPAPQCDHIVRDFFNVIAFKIEIHHFGVIVCVDEPGADRCFGDARAIGDGFKSGALGDWGTRKAAPPRGSPRKRPQQKQEDWAEVRTEHRTGHRTGHRIGLPDWQAYRAWFDSQLSQRVRSKPGSDRV